MNEQTTNIRPHIRLEMVSNPVYLSGAREMIAAVARRLGFSDEGCGQIALAVDEALCNIIRHGYERKADRPIWVSVWPIGAGGENAGTERAQGLRIVIEDEARQIDPGKIKSRDLDEVRPGGLGVHIIREVMDEVRYEKRENSQNGTDGVGMRLTLVKRLGPGGGAGRKPTGDGHGTVESGGCCGGGAAGGGGGKSGA
jgi:anti-sigma regulatory factor (Ser/Thr protein kinase)